MGSIYLATQRQTQNNRIPSYTAAETSRLANWKFYTFTALLPETRLISESRSEMLRPHRISVLL